MSEDQRSALKPPKGRRARKTCRPLLSTVQLSDEQRKQEKTPTKGQDITPQEKEVEGASVVQGKGKGPALEATQEERVHPKTGRKCAYGLDDKGKQLPNLEPIKMPEAGEEKPQV